MSAAPSYGIGTVFTPVGRKTKNVCTVTDILTTRNTAGEVVKIRYVATHDFCGQTVTDHDVLEVTIARGLVGTTLPPIADI